MKSPLLAYTIQAGHKRGEQMEQTPTEIEKKIEHIEAELGSSSDLTIRRLEIGVHRLKIAVIWIKGMVEVKALNESVLSPLLLHTKLLALMPNQPNGLELICGNFVTAFETVYAEMDRTVPLLLSGYTLIVADGFEQCAAIDTQGYLIRGIEEPSSTVVVRGPRDGFIECFEVNVTLIRRRLQNRKIRVETMVVGEISQTSVSMMYLEDRASKEVVDEVRQRLQNIDIDAVLESQYIEELIRDNKGSIFPTVYSTERPDDAASGIVEGRVAIIVDGTPFVLLVPCTFFHLMKTAEDNYRAYPIATFIRWIRFTGLLITLLFPSLYVAILMFHPELVPPQLLSSVLSAREGVPFPLILEAVIMEMTFEGLREAGVRMPRAIGSAISIVGALVIGESAVNAGIISSPTIIVVAGTAIASFVIPSIELSGAIRLLRFFMLIWASLLGLYGIIFGLILLAIHLTTLESVGTPYLYPITPFNKREAMKTFFRMPWWSLNEHTKGRRR
ncbi:spore germination protein [Paenibacillaceae bacterium]|nr:spore germination protein [Paenibacillaceae bacterium]